MKWNVRNRFVSHGAAVAVGFLSGLAIFRWPTFACGPFNSDRFALWAAAVAGSAAALATYYAARVALRGGREAISNERALRALEQDNIARERARKKNSLATIFIAPLFSLALMSEAWLKMTQEPDIDVYDISERVRVYRTDVIDALMSNILELDGTELAHFALAYGRLKILISDAQTLKRDPGLSEAHISTQKKIIVSILESLAQASYSAWKVFLTMTPGLQATNDPREEARQYAIHEIAEIRAMKRGDTAAPPARLTSVDEHPLIDITVDKQSSG